MASLPGIRQTIRDGALGLLALGSDYHCKIGLCTSGPIDTPIGFGDPEAVRSTFGRGPLVEALVEAIERTGNPVIGIRATQASPGSIDAFTQTGTSPLITATGSAPEDAFDVRVEILVGGDETEAEFRYSLDGGDTWSQPIAAAASYVIPDSGITIQFPAGTYVVGELYSATCTPPAFDVTGLGTALDAAFASAEQWRLVHVVGFTADAAAAATVATAVAAKMDAAEALYRYAYAVLEMPDVSDADLQTEFAAFASPRVMLCAGFTELVSAVSTRVYKRPAAWPIVARIMSVPVSRDPGAVEDGGLAGIRSLYRDEDKTPGLDAAGFCVLRTYKGRPGYFVTRGTMSAAPTSDFRSSPNRQVMDVASRVAYEALLAYINVDLRVNEETGTLLEIEARRIESRVEGRLNDALISPEPPDASAVQFVVSRSEPILSTETLRSKTRVIPKGYARWIENEIAFRNPALEPA